MTKRAVKLQIIVPKRSSDKYLWMILVLIPFEYDMTSFWKEKWIDGVGCIIA